MKVSRSIFRVVAVLIISIVIFCVLSGSNCDGTNTTQRQDFLNNKLNVQGIISRQPTPALSFSMDRYIHIERAIRFNDPNHMSYLYVFMANGSVIEMTIVGKVASTSKRLTNPVDILGDDTNGYYQQPAADVMAMFGESSGGKAGISTFGSLFEFGGGFMSYFESETPATFTDKRTGQAMPVIGVDFKMSDKEKQSFLRELGLLQKVTKKAFAKDLENIKRQKQELFQYLESGNNN